MFFRKKPRHQPNTPWLKWVVLAFVIYAIVISQQSGTKSHEAIKTASHELNPKNMIRFDEYKKLIFPSSPAPLNIRDVSPGNGTQVTCGQEVTIAYDAFLPDNTAIGDSASKEKPLVFTIGAGKAMQVFQQGVMGMNIGAKRSLVAPAAMAYGTKEYARENVPEGSMARFEVELLAATPVLPEMENTPYRVANIKRGGGMMVGCGDSVKADVTLWDVEGKKLYSTKDEGHAPLAFTLGKSEVFYGLEQGVLGMSVGGARTLIVPPALQKPLVDNKDAVKFPLPAHQTVLVDVDVLP